MANAKTWPASLKKPTLASASISLEFGYENSEMEAGTLLQRARFPEPTGRRTVEFHCTTLEASRALDFLRRLAGAAFDMPLAVPGDPDAANPTVSARFLGGVGWRAIDGRTGMMSFDAFVEALPPLQEDGFYDYFDWAGNDYAQLVENMVNSGPVAA